MPLFVSLLVSLAVSRIGCNPFGNRESAVSLAVSLAVSESVLSTVPQAARKAVRRRTSAARKAVGRATHRARKAVGRATHRARKAVCVGAENGRRLARKALRRRAGWRWLGVSAARHIAALAGGSLAHTFGVRSFFKARLVCHRPGPRAARCPPWRPFFSGLGWSFIVQLFFVGSAGCSWPPGRPAGCTAPPSSFFKVRLV